MAIATTAQSCKIFLNCSGVVKSSFPPSISFVAKEEKSATIFEMD
jgi:hypothetical protein